MILRVLCVFVVEGFVFLDVSGNISYYPPMNAVAKPRDEPQEKRGQGQRTWTDAQRAQQAVNLRARQIWLKSTGPKTEQGKINTSKNARHADYEYRMADRAELRAMNTYLRTQKSYTDLLKLFLKQEHSLSVARQNAYIDALFFLENKLIDIERQIFGGMTFYEVAGLDNRQNIIPFRRKGRKSGERDS